MARAARKAAEKLAGRIKAHEDYMRKLSPQQQSAYKRPGSLNRNS